MSASCFAQQLGQVCQLADARGTQTIGDQHTGNIDAVEYVAHVVKHSGGHLGHAGEPRKFDQAFLRVFQLGVRPVFGRDLFAQLARALGDPLFQFAFGFEQRLSRFLAGDGGAQHFRHGSH